MLNLDKLTGLPALASSKLRLPPTEPGIVIAVGMLVGEGAVMMERRKRCVSNATLVTMIIVLLLLGVAVVLPNLIYPRRDRNYSEIKATLHNIQLSVERYAVDHNGQYPQYLIGGESGSEPNLASDVLLREGYIDSYPRNPFSRPQSQYGGMDVLTMQQRLPFSYYGGDPLRPGCAEGDKYGYRFGRDGSLMGQVLCDARWPAWYQKDQATGELTEHHTWADVEYRFWDMWLDPDSNEPSLPYSPGQFFYKGLGPIVSIPADYDPETRPAMRPTEIDQYILGAYGSLQTKGYDVLGREEAIKYKLRENQEAGSDGRSDRGDQEEIIVWPTTHSTLDNRSREGSPYSTGVGTASEWVQAGNPDGIPDSIILVLTAGEDYIGDR